MTAEGRLALRQINIVDVIRSKFFIPDATKFSAVSPQIRGTIISLLLQVASGSDNSPSFGKQVEIRRYMLNLLRTSRTDERNRAREFMVKFTDRMCTTTREIYT